MDKLKSFFVRIANKVKDITLRFPGVVFFLIVCYIFNPSRWGPNESLFCLCRFGFWLSFALEIMLENLKQKGAKLRLVCYGAMIALLTALLFTGFFDDVLDLDYVFGVMALYVLAIVVFAHKNRGSFEKNCMVLFVNWVKAELFSWLFILGVNILLFASRKVFGIKLGFLQKEVLLIGVIFLSNFIFLAGVPRVGDELKVSKFLIDILKYIFVPIELGGVVILILYMVKDAIVLGNGLGTGLLIITIPIMIFAIIVSVFAKVVEEETIEKSRKVLAILVIPVLLVTIWLAVRFYIDHRIMILLYLMVIECVTVAVFIGCILFKDSKYQYMGFLVLMILLIVASKGPLSAKNILRIDYEEGLDGILEVCKRLLNRSRMDI